jgi:hypothetical protein
MDFRLVQRGERRRARVATEFRDGFGGRERVSRPPVAENSHVLQVLDNGGRSSDGYNRRSKWAQELLSRAGHNKTLVAMANKMARIAWAILRSEQNCRTA